MEVVGVEFKKRITGKSVIRDGDKIALVGTTVNYIYTLPGGGVNEGEDISTGITREAKEETGCTVVLTEMLGVIEDYRNRDKKHCISYCAITNVVGEKGALELTSEEEKNGLHVKWLTKEEEEEEALCVLENEYKNVLKGEINYYNTAYNIVRDYEFIKEYIDKLEK